MPSIRYNWSGTSERGPAKVLLRRTIALAALFASSGVIRAQDRVSPTALVSRQAVLRPEKSESTYSVELPIVVRRVRFLACPGCSHDSPNLEETLQTSVNLINNTPRNGVLANYQFSYTCVAAACSPQGGFYRTSVQQVTLAGLGLFHQDDFVHYLATLGLLQPGADQSAVGTLLVTFSNLGSASGWEANAIGTTYSSISIFGSDPRRGSAGFAYNASLFFDSAESTLIGFAGDIMAFPTVAGPWAEVGIRSTDILGTNQNVTVDLSFYDTATGQRVGNFVTLSDIRPGELRQVADVWTSAGIPSTVGSVIIFADARNPSAFSPTIEGFVLLDEVQKAQRFLTMLCADLDGCGN